jgi:hypothetical protein
MRNFGSPPSSFGAPSSSAEEPSLIELVLGGAALVVVGVGALGLAVGLGSFGGVAAGSAAVDAYKKVTGKKVSQEAEEKVVMTSTALFALGLPAFITYKTATMTDADRAAHRAEYGGYTP